MSDRDDFDEIFRDFRRFVGPVSGAGPLGESIMDELTQLESEEIEVDDELVLGNEEVTYLLFDPRRDLDDFEVSANEDELVVKTKEFVLRRRTGGRIEPSSKRTTYANGVLSVKLKRRRG